jgi:hypothetical protein
LDWIIEFIAPYTFTQFGFTGNYSAVAILHTLQFTVAHALRFSVSTSRLLATDLSQCRCNFKSHMKSAWQRLIPFLPFLTVSFYNTSARTTEKPACIVDEACLLHRCLAIDVLFRAFASAGMCFNESLPNSECTRHIMYGSGHGQLQATFLACSKWTLTKS